MNNHSHEHENCSCHSHDEKHTHCGHHEEHKHEHHGECCCHEHGHHSEEGCCSHSHHHEGCGCEHNHHDGCGCSHSHHNYNPRNLITKGIAVIVFIISLLTADFGVVSTLLSAVAIVLCGYEIFWQGIKSIVKLKFDENTLILLAVISSVIMQEQNEGFLITVLFSVGGFLEGYAVSKSRKRIENLIDATSDTAHNELGESIDPKLLRVGDTFLVKPGDKVCVDAVISKGTGVFDTSAITGESLPRTFEEGENIVSGYVNVGSSIVCVATSDYENSTASKIKKYVENAGRKKAATENFITKFASVYTPVVIIAALIMGITLAVFGITEPGEAFRRALTFMIASCPCALVISIPLAYYASIGAISRYGLLVKGSKYINEMAKADAIVFDKTGTLTKGNPEVSEIRILGKMSENEILALVKSVEIHSLHPVAETICRYYDGEYPKAENVKEHIGKGMEGTADSKHIAVGTAKLASLLGYEIPESSDGIAVYMDGTLSAVIYVTDTLKADAKDTVNALSDMDFKEICMLSGDNEMQVTKTARILGINSKGNLSPNEKAAEIASLKEKHKGVIFAGDGVNDAPALSEADFSISIGTGSSIALETGDATLVSESLGGIPKSIKKARYTCRVIAWNIVLAIAFKLAVLVMAATGYAPIWLAVFADVGTLIITIINSLTIFIKK